MAASRSLLRPAELAVNATRATGQLAAVALAEGDASRGCFCSLACASIFSSYEAVGLEMIFLSSTR